MVELFIDRGNSTRCEMKTLAFALSFFVAALGAAGPAAAANDEAVPHLFDDLNGDGQSDEHVSGEESDRPTEEILDPDQTPYYPPEEPVVESEPSR
jgi:hypothetical protein